jgi:hypothetical protein
MSSDTFNPEDAHEESAVAVVEDQENLDLSQVAAEIEALQSKSLDSNELAKQLEDLTGVVLNSAEASTRSASVAADVSGDMQKVMQAIGEAHQRSVNHSRILLGAMLVFILISIGTFFAISTRMRQNIIQLDSLSMAVGKRVVELDATLGTFTESTQSFGELTEKLEGLQAAQAKIDKRMEEMDKVVSDVPKQVGEQSNKALQEKLSSLEKQLQALDSKLITLGNRPQPNLAAAQQSMTQEFQKLKKDLEVSSAKAREAANQAQVAAAAANAKPKVVSKPEAKVESKPDLKTEVKPKEAGAEAPRATPLAAAPPAPNPQFQPSREKELVYPRPNVGKASE